MSTEPDDGTRAADRDVADALSRLVYDELRRIADRLRRAERSNHTLAPTEIAHEAEPSDIDVLALEEALAALEARNERQARVIELRVFSGLTVEQIAPVLGVSVTTVKREWRHARAWLHRALTHERPAGSGGPS